MQVNLLEGTLRVGDTARDVLASIENITVIDFGSAVVNGSPADNLIELHNGDNIVYAGMGYDTIYSGSILSEGGSELLNGGGGNDLIEGGFSSSTTVPEPPTGLPDQILIGGAGDDTLSTGVSYVRMSGGEGVDEFWFAASGAYNAPQATITDYQAGENLGILNIPDLTYAGETDNPGLMEIGYHREGSDTVIEANTGPDTSEPLNIRLENYTGPLAADDFLIPS